MSGTVVYGFIPGLQLDKPVKDVWDVSIYYGRPTSFFREPAHYAIYVMPIYALCLFRKKYLLSVIFLAGLLISTSSTGLFGTLVITGVYVAGEKRIPIIFKWIMAILGVVLVIQFIPSLDESSVLDKLKFVNLAENDRVLGTLPYFKYFGLKELFFGVGLNQLSDYLSIYTSLDVENYANSLFFSFFSFGLVGGVFWTYYMFRLHRLSRFKMVYVTLIIVYMSDQILFNRNLVYLLMLLHVFSDAREDAPRGGEYLVRTRKSVKNIVVTFALQGLSILISFFARQYFISRLGMSYLGLNGIFDNVLNMLSLAELGFSTAFMFALFKPIAAGDHDRIRALMRYFRKIYMGVGAVILTAGLAVVPLLHLFITTDIPFRPRDPVLCPLPGRRLRDLSVLL